MKAPDPIAAGTLPGEVVRFARQVLGCLLRGLTLEENHRGTLVRATGLVSDTLPADFRTDLATVPLEVRVCSMARRDGDGTRTSGNKVTWLWAASLTGGGTVRVTAIDGMTSGIAYDVALWIGGG